MPYCYVENCKNRSSTTNLKTSGVSYHRFPRDPHTRKLWILATGKKNWMPAKHSTICSMHFQANDYKFSGSFNTLKKFAYPTVNVWSLPQDDIRGGKQTSEIKLNKNSILLDNKSFTNNVTACHIAVNSEDKMRSEQLQDLPEGKVIITRVYNYFKTEYEILKAFTGNEWELNPLVDYLQRTVEATGLNKVTITKILEDQKDAEYLEHRAVLKEPDEEELQVNDDRTEHQDEFQTEKLKKEIDSEEEIGEQCEDEFEIEELKMEIDVEDEQIGRRSSLLPDTSSTKVKIGALNEGEQQQCEPDRRGDSTATVGQVKEEYEDEKEMLKMEFSINNMICDAFNTSLERDPDKLKPSQPPDR